MELLARIVISGIALGCAWGFIGLGISIIYGVSRVVNFAQGEFLMVGAFVYFLASEVLHWHPILSLLLAMAAAAILGILVQRIIVEPLVRRKVPPVNIIMATLAASLIIIAAVGIPTDYAFFKVTPLLGIKLWEIGPIAVNPQYPLVILVSLLLVFGYWFFLHHTIWGIGIRAIGSSREAGEAAGVKPTGVMALCFAISAPIAALCGVLIGFMATPSPHMGMDFLIKGFIAAVIGGIGNPYGAIVGGALLGLIYQLSTGYIASGFADLMVFVVLLFVLVIRPKGILGRSSD